MAVTNVAHKVGQLLQTSKFAVDTDNDEIIPVGREQIVVGAFFEGLATALNIDAGIIQHIGADLIALSTHGRTGLAHLLSGSIAEDVVSHANRPVLTRIIQPKK